MASLLLLQLSDISVHEIVGKVANNLSDFFFQVKFSFDRVT